MNNQMTPWQHLRWGATIAAILIILGPFWMKADVKKEVRQSLANQAKEIHFEKDLKGIEADAAMTANDAEQLYRFTAGTNYSADR